MTRKLIRNGLVAAALMNIGGVLVFSRAFTNESINNADPVVMSNFGLIMIIVWGAAYLGAATIDGNISWLAAAFALEKLVYVVAWALWMSCHSLSEVYSDDLLAGVFFSIYGVNDLLFGIFFVWVFVSQRSAIRNE